MSRETYVFRNDKFILKSRDGVLTDEYLSLPPIGQSVKSFQIMPDINPYKSTIDGSMITSRKQHRDHLRAHGCFEVGNEKFPQSRPKTEHNVRPELMSAIQQHMGRS